MFQGIIIHFNVSIFIIRRQSGEKGIQQMKPKQATKHVWIIDRGRKQKIHVYNWLLLNESHKREQMRKIITYKGTIRKTLSHGKTRFTNCLTPFSLCNLSQLVDPLSLIYHAFSLQQNCTLSCKMHISKLAHAKHGLYLVMDLREVGEDIHKLEYGWLPFIIVL